MGLGKDEFLDLAPLEFDEIFTRWRFKLDQDREAALTAQRFAVREALYSYLTFKRVKNRRILPWDLYELPGEAELKKAKLEAQKATAADAKAAHLKYESYKK